MNPNKIVRILYVGVSPIQNAKPFRLMKSHREIEATVVYLKKPEVNIEKDQESITKAAFDIDMLSGYKYHFLKTYNKTGNGFFSLISFEIIQWVRSHDVVVIYGHNYFTFWIAMIAAKIFNRKLVQTTDAIYMQATASSGGWKMKFKPLFLRTLYNRFVDGVFVTSTASKLFLQSVEIKVDKIAVIPYAVDEDVIQKISDKTNVEELKEKLGIQLTDMVFVFCAKFIPRKRPQDAIEAFAKMDTKKATLVMIGDGPMMKDLKQTVNNFGLELKIIFTGLVKYSELPAYYTMGDALVFCSEHEPYGLPVNEAMLCGKPAIVSDRIGARLDLVAEEKTGWIYATADVKQLTTLLNKSVVYKANGKLAAMGEAARQRMSTWSSQTNLKNQLNFFKSRNWIS